MPPFAQSIGKLLRYILYILLSVYVITFSVANREKVSLELFPFGYEITLPAFVLIFISFALGVFGGNVSLWLSRIYSSNKSRRSKQHIEALENEISVLESTYSEQQPTDALTTTSSKST